MGLLNRLLVFLHPDFEFVVIAKVDEQTFQQRAFKCTMATPLFRLARRRTSLLVSWNELIADALRREGLLLLSLLLPLLWRVIGPCQART